MRSQQMGNAIVTYEAISSSSKLLTLDNVVLAKYYTAQPYSKSNFQNMLFLEILTSTSP